MSLLAGRAAATPQRDAEANRWQRALRAGRRWGLWGAAVGIALGLVTQAPAQWLADGLQQASSGRLLLAEARGSLWNGSAVLVLTGGAGSRDASALPGRLEWTLRPGLAGLQLSAHQACCLPQPLRLLLVPGWNGYTLSVGGQPTTAAAAPPSGTQVLGQWPASWLSGLGTPWNTLQLGGQLQLSGSGLHLRSASGRVQLAGMLQLQLRGASSRLSPLPALGSYQLQVQGAPARGNDATRLLLSTTEGPLRLTGEGQLTGTGLRFRGTAQATDGQDQALANLLNIIGRRQGALSVISIG